MKRRTATGLLIAGALLWTTVGSHAGQTPEAADIRIMAVGDNVGLLFLLSGGGTPHALAFGGEDEQITLIDTKASGTGEIVLDKVHLGADGEVVRVILTGPTRAMSVDEFPTATEIVAHENTKAAMAEMSAFSGDNAKFLPNRTFEDTESFTVQTVGEEDGTNRIDLYHFGPGSTSGDTVVVFPSLNTVFLGDLFPGSSVPVIDTAHGGSAVALPDTLDKAVAALEAVEPPIKFVLPGRQAPPPGPYVPFWLMLRHVRDYAEFTHALLASVKESAEAGRSVDEAVANLAVPAKFESYKMDGAAAYVQAAYDELKR